MCEGHLNFSLTEEGAHVTAGIEPVFDIIEEERKRN